MHSKVGYGMIPNKRSERNEDPVCLSGQHLQKPHGGICDEGYGEEGGAEKKREYLQSRDLPVHAGMYQIRTDEHGTGVVGKSQEILCFPATDLSAGIEIGSKFGSHGITTEQPKKNGISSGRRNTEDFLPDGFHGG